MAWGEGQGAKGLALRVFVLAQHVVYRRYIYIVHNIVYRWSDCRIVYRWSDCMLLCVMFVFLCVCVCVHCV